MVTEEVPKEGFEIEAFAVKNVELFERVHNGLCVLLGGFIISLDLKQEPVELIDGHDPVFGVTVKQGSDLARGFGYCQLEPPRKAEAHTVCLLRHERERERERERLSSSKFCYMF